MAERKIPHRAVEVGSPWSTARNIKDRYLNSLTNLTLLLGLPYVKEPAGLHETMDSLNRSEQIELAVHLIRGQAEPHWIPTHKGSAEGARVLLTYINILDFTPDERAEVTDAFTQAVHSPYPKTHTTLEALRATGEILAPSRQGQRDLVREKYFIMARFDVEYTLASGGTSVKGMFAGEE